MDGWIYGCLLSSHYLRSSILIGLLHFGILPSVNILQAKITPTQKSLSPITSANRIALTKPEGYTRPIITKPNKNSCDLIRAQSRLIKAQESVAILTLSVECNVKS